MKNDNTFCPNCKEDLEEKIDESFDGELFDVGDNLTIQCPCCMAGVEVYKRKNNTYSVKLGYKPDPNL